MGRLHYCYNGRSVTEQVILYQKTREGKDYAPVQLYYDDYKDHWFTQLEDYMDRQTFESDFDYKLSCAVNAFKETTAKRLQKEKGYRALGAFNGLFYQILSNWKSNIKTSCFRLKKRPSIQCPVCGRNVGRIDEKHLQHYKSPRDLPKYVVFEGQIYECYAQPRMYATCWGDKTKVKLRALQNKNTKMFKSDKRRVRWPWKNPDGSKGVLCPFTKKIVPQIDDNYLRTLPNKYSRYAEPLRWAEFHERYPTALIQSEIFDLHHLVGYDDKSCILDHISKDCRVTETVEMMDLEMILEEQPAVKPGPYEYVFHIIDENIEDKTDRRILKLISAGYTVDDIAHSLEMPKKDVRTRMRAVKEDKDFEIMLKRV